MLHLSTTLFLILIFYPFLLSGVDIDPYSIEKLKNHTAPEFELRTEGTRKNLSSFRKGVTIIHFWAEWSPSYKTELPSLINLLKTTGNDKLTIIAITGKENNARIPDIPGFYYLNDVSLKIHRSYRVYMIPTTFIINKEGVIVEIFMGERNWLDKKIIDLIRRLTE